MKYRYLWPCLLLAACDVMPSEARLFNPDEEFAKLDGPEVPTVQKSLERGAILALSDGNFSRAAGLYDQLMDHDPKQMRYTFGMAESLRRLGEYKAAIFLYEKVLQAEPSHTDAKEGLGLAKMAVGETEQAARILQKVLEEDSKRWRTLNALGILFAIKEMTPEATAYLKEALKVSPNNPSVLNNLGLIHASKREYIEAVRALKEASRLTDNEIKRQQIDMNRALVHGIEGDLEAAESVASLHLDKGSLQNNLGLYAYLSNNRELAKSYLNMALAGTQTHYRRAWDNLDIIANADDEDGKSASEGKRVKIK